MAQTTPSPSDSTATPPGPPPSAAPRPRVSRWRSYHFYVVLALFDVAVIVASIIAQDSTVASFDRALSEVNAVQKRHLWLTELGQWLIRMNAPGNNIFETRQYDQERRTFIAARERLMEKLDNPPSEAQPPRRFVDHVNKMIHQEESIFERFKQILRQDTPPERRQTLLEEALTSMAEMDRAQAGAMAALVSENHRLHRDQQLALDEHNRILNDRTMVEIVFVLIVLLILVGVTWYWRQLQKMHESFVREQERAERERQNRLAAVGEVCFSVAHGIRNPVAAIASSAQLVLEFGQLDPPSRQRVQDVFTACGHLNDRVTRLLNFARETTHEHTPLDPATLLDQAAGELAPQLREHGIRVRRRYEHDGATIEGDRNQLVQALIELLSNAREILTDGGEVMLICRQTRDPSGFVEFGVIDNGPGIPDEIKQRACELFFTRKEGGTGVGLASVRRSAELHNGTVLIADAIPHGADIRLRIPQKRG